MSLYIASLNSGSNGNCYYIGNEEEAVLIDAGLSCRETEKRLIRMGLDISKIKAIFISHEHADHINGLCGLVKKYQFPVYITEPTLTHSRMELSGTEVFTFKSYKPVKLGRLTITAFPKYHDAIDPHSFTIQCEKVCVGVFTDIGVVCDHVIQNFKNCHAVFLEANYDEVMLDNGHYPYHLKNRIRGGRGHISNKEAMALFLEYRPPFMTHLFLSHLSRENNCPDLVRNIFMESTLHTEVVIASRFQETPVYHINHPEELRLPEPRPVNSLVPALKMKRKVKGIKNEFQLSLF